MGRGAVPPAARIMCDSRSARRAARAASRQSATSVVARAVTWVGGGFGREGVASVLREAVYTWSSVVSDIRAFHSAGSAYGLLQAALPYRVSSTAGSSSSRAVGRAFRSAGVAAFQVPTLGEVPGAGG